MNKRKAEDALAKETLQKAERNMLICFIKGVMLYRLAEETKQRVYEDWKSEGFEETLHSAMKVCNEMRDDVDKFIAELITIVPELEEFAKELKVKFEEINKMEESHEQENEQK